RVARRIRATAGLCLSTGGFIYNRAMIHHYAPQHDVTAPMGNPGDDGSGIRMGQTAGGAVQRLGHISSWRFLNPPGPGVKGMIVKRAGRRFVDETLYGASVGHELNDNQGGIGWLIIDGELKWKAWRELLTLRMERYQRIPGILSMFAMKSAPT